MRKLSLAALLLACGGKPPIAMTPHKASSTDAESMFAPLDVGADFASYHKVSTEPFLSKTHGGRFVEVYVNDVGLKAYMSAAPFPVGSVVVKMSWEPKDGKPSDVAGPLFVMRKEVADYAPEHDDWYYAIRWETPPPEQLRLLGGPIYWRGRSQKVGYCQKCHDNYDRSMGGVPTGKRAWEAK